LISIPMADPDLRSLNLSTCVAIAVYEVLRQWHGRDSRA
jgi:tRNA(Leu) C34 or U34 (ribose-2'-O)-methylase TrmL